MLADPSPLSPGTQITFALVALGPCFGDHLGFRYGTTYINANLGEIHESAVSIVDNCMPHMTYMLHFSLSFTYSYMTCKHAYTHTLHTYLNNSRCPICLHFFFFTGTLGTPVGTFGRGSLAFWASGRGAIAECLGLLDVLLYHDPGGRQCIVLGTHQQSRQGWMV